MLKENHRNIISLSKRSNIVKGQVNTNGSLFHNTGYQFRTYKKCEKKENLN